MKVKKDTDFSVISKHTPGFLEIVHKNLAKTLQKMHYPSLLMFDHRDTDTPNEKKVWNSIFFGIGALANASPDTSAKFWYWRPTRVEGVLQLGHGEYILYFYVVVYSNT